MRIFIVVMSSTFLTVAIASSFSSKRLCGATGDKSGVDNTTEPEGSEVPRWSLHAGGSEEEKVSINTLLGEGR